MMRSPNLSQTLSRTAPHAGALPSARAVNPPCARGALLSLVAGGLIAVCTPHTSAQSAYPPVDTSAGASQSGASQPSASQPAASQRNMSSMDRGQEYASLDARIESVVRRTLEAQQRAEAAERERLNMERASSANDLPVPLNLE